MSSKVFIRRISVIAIAFAIIIAMAVVCVNAATVSVQSATGYVNSSSGLTLRKSASTSSAKLATLKDNTKLTIKYEVFKSNTSTAKSKKWYCVTANGKNGYVRSDYVDGITYTGVSGTTSNAVNYRAGAGSSMKKYGRFSKGKALTIYLKAKPNNSSTYWYKVKVNGSYRYVSSAYVKLATVKTEPATTTTTTNTSTSTTTNNTTSNTTTNTTTNTTDFESYMTAQGFPETYKDSLRALHKAHPKWTFVAQKVGVAFDTAVSKEAADGVSLIQKVTYGVKGLDTSTYSYTKGGSTKIYSSASTSSTSKGTVADNTTFTILGAKRNGSTTFYKIKTSGGITGFIAGAPTYQKYTTSKTGVVASTVNVRSQPDANSTAYKSYSKGTKVEIVLPAENAAGEGWYMIRYGDSFAFVSAKWITVDGSVLAANSMNGLDVNGFLENKQVKEEEQTESPEQQLEVEVIEAEPMEDALEVLDLGDGQIVTDESEVDAVTALVDDPELTIIDQEPLEEPIEITEEPIIEEQPSDESEEDDPLDDAFIKAMGSLSMSGSGKMILGSFKAKDGSTWFNADKAVVAYYMDPRHFLNEDRIYMFENLSFSSYQTVSTVDKVLAGSKIPGAGYKSAWFYNYGKQYGVSPVHLAARARQETGGGSVALTGYQISGTYYYNPFNIGATSGSNPVINGMNYAKSQGWNTKEKAIQGGAKFLATGYINNNQDTLYTQKFNVANGSTKIATHQYMTNVMAAYSEAISVKNSYATFGIVNEPLVFKIPVYTTMPGSTVLP